MPVRIDSVLIETTRIDEMMHFYRYGLGLDEPDTLDSDQIGFQIGDVYLGLEHVEEKTEPSRTISLWFKVEDARKVYDSLLTLGATPKDAPAEIDDEIVASVFDPDGNAIGLLSDL